MSVHRIKSQCWLNLSLPKYTIETWDKQWRSNTEANPIYVSNCTACYRSRYSSMWCKHQESITFTMCTVPATIVIRKLTLQRLKEDVAWRSTNQLCMTKQSQNRIHNIGVCGSWLPRRYINICPPSHWIHCSQRLPAKNADDTDQNVTRKQPT